MKVISKAHRNNKSTPLLPYSTVDSLKPTTKPKGISQVTKMKNELKYAGQVHPLGMGSHCQFKSE